MVTRHILVFAGQGSDAHFSDRDKVDKLLYHLGDDARSSWIEFLAASHGAFIELYQALSSDDRSIFTSDVLATFSTPDDLLQPGPSFQSHPVFQATTLFLRQILELMLYERTHGHDSVVTEATGVCTGVLPAMLASSFSSYLSTDFVRAAVEGFKISFSIGLRSSLYCRRFLGEDWKKHPCVLSVFKLDSKHVQEQLETHNEKMTASSPSTMRLKVSAVFDDDTVSVSGSGESLSSFQSALHAEPQQVTCRWTHVHGLYHGGENLKEVVEEVMEDIRSSCGWIPCWASLHAPVRSAATGAHFQRNGQDHSLLRLACESIFVDTVDWKSTWEAVLRVYSEKSRLDLGAKFQVMGIGPSSKTLVNSQRRNSNVQDSNLQVVEQFANDLDKVKEDDIAIVGVSANFPGGKGLEEFWKVIEEGKSCATEIPPSRFNVSDYHQTDGGRSSKPRTMASKHGNFLDDPFTFDAGFFHISPREAKSMDPQQRLLLHAAVEALDDAGYCPDGTESFKRDSFGVYVGVATGDYVDNLRDDIDVYYSPGTLRAFLSGRISYTFGFKGPSMVIDTACSSSLVSIYHAYNALQSGDCTAALAGGVNVISSPDMYLGLSRAHFLSPTGQCKPFDVAADGYCRAEGCGLVVLKKLSHARAEGDHIYGVIRGVGINQCGTAKSITHPDHKTQTALFSQLLYQSNISPRTIDVVEAHGTGTQAGDLAEVSSLSAIFKDGNNGRPRPEADRPLYLGSVKGNIGHSEAASGVAGLIKLLLMMRSESIPRQASFETLNPRLAEIMADDNDGNASIRTRMVVPDSPQKWTRGPGGRRRRALLNNFGAAGSNAALILEEAPSDMDAVAREGNQQASRSKHLLTISAKSIDALELLKSDFSRYIRENRNVSVQDLCYTANARRQHHKGFRWAASGAHIDELLGPLERYDTPPSQRTTSAPKKIVFVFSGQGGAHKGMGVELLRTSPSFQTAVEDCDDILVHHGFPNVSSFLDPTADGVNNDETTSTTEHDVVVVAQCACFVLQYALTRFFGDLGVVPDLVLGHSIGEYAALVASGVLGLKDALLFVAKRASLMYTRCEPKASGMLACRVSPSEASIVLGDGILGTTDNVESRPGVVSLACHNSPQDCVIAGPKGRLDEVSELCTSKGIRNKLLDVAYGFHSSAMDPILPELEDVADSMTVRPPTKQLGSSVRGTILRGDEILSSSYFVEQTRQPVLFLELLANIRTESENLQSSLHVVEIGPSTATSSMWKSAMAGADYSYTPSLRPSEGPWSTITSVLQSLYLSGKDLNWAELYKGNSSRFLSIPSYPLIGQHCVVPFQESTFMQTQKVEEDATALCQTELTFLSSSTISQLDAAQGSTTFQLNVDRLSDFIKAHAVGGVPLCPASIYIELALEAMAVTRKVPTNETLLYVIDGTSFDHPLVYSDTKWQLAKVNVREKGRSQEASGSVAFSVTTGEPESSNHLNCSGSISSMAGQSAAELFALKSAYVKRQKSTMFNSSATLETFTSRTIYDVIFPRVVSYSSPFRTLEHLTISTLGLEGYGTFKLQDPDLQSPQANFVSPPPFLDTILHAAGFVANSKADLNTACICVSLDRILLPDMSAIRLRDHRMDIYCSLIDVEDSTVADAYVLGRDGQVVSFAEGMRFKKVRLSSFKTVLSRAAGTRPGTQTPAVSGPPRKWEAPKTLDSTRNQEIAALVPENKAAPVAPPSLSPSRVETVVQEMLQAVCGIPWDPTSRRTLAELGVDSLLFIELTQSIASQFPDLDVPKDDIEKCLTPDDLIRLLVQAQRRHQSNRPNVAQGTGIDSLSSSLSSSALSSSPKANRPSPQINNLPTPPAERVEIDCIASEIQDLFTNLCGRSFLERDKDASLASLGVDSLLSIELVHELRQRFNLDLETLQSSVSDMTINNIEALLGSAKMSSPVPPNAPDAETSDQAKEQADHDYGSHDNILSRLIPETFPHILQEEDSTSHTANLPLFLFHDGSGLSNMYSRLKPLRRRVRGIFSPDLAAIDPSIQTLQDMATRYIDRAGLMSENKPILCGWSFGGVLAFEVTRQLLLRGRTPGGLILLDSPLPVRHEPLPDEIISHVVGKTGTRRGAAKARSCIEAQFRRHAGLLKKYEAEPLPKQQQDGGQDDYYRVPCAAIVCKRTMDTDALCGISYPWLSDSGFRNQALKGWSRLLGQDVWVLDVDCNHFEVFEPPNIDDVSTKIQTACKMLEEASDMT